MLHTYAVLASHDGSSAKETINRLEAEIVALRQKLESRPMDTQELAKEAMTSSQFTPVPSTNCFGVKPCLHSTAADRLAAGCLDAVWDGTYGSGTKYKHVTLGNLSFEQPVAPTELERFHPRVGDVCDLSDIWQVSNLHRGHVKDASNICQGYSRYMQSAFQGHVRVPADDCYSSRCSRNMLD